ncbi:HTH domain-containing protein [Bifidobacterium oedipodis]|uniref:Uncharacterized protein n=1 Tax=Bifidobacterium oedipodis TaxID=2675322 RepID=A0A7Y0HUD0_9BIFI|nr:HTH domain-containing protein [Bifidobacterium sp. DSM 109957]NMM94624.1 hypothetical protein [Bifidobacterium sp. DSM 109957]
MRTSPTNRSRTFTRSEMRYLKMLPAVAGVSATRITYSDEFRDEATRRYLAGQSPVQIFREAGLDPSLVGYKRIERSFARWKAAARSGASGTRAAGTASSPGIQHTSSVTAEPSIDSMISSSNNTVPSAIERAWNNADPKVREAMGEPKTARDEDSRDHLIARQALRIADLENLVDRLYREIDDLRKAGERTAKERTAIERKTNERKTGDCKAINHRAVGRSTRNSSQSFPRG